MLVDMVAVGLVEVAVVEVVHMAAMFDGGVAAAGSVDVGVIVVDIMLDHDCSPWFETIRGPAFARVIHWRGPWR